MRPEKLIADGGCAVKAEMTKVPNMKRYSVYDFEVTRGKGQCLAVLAVLEANLGAVLEAEIHVSKCVNLEL